MEHSPQIIKFEVFKDNICIHSGTTWTLMLPTLSDAYINFPESPYTLKIIYQDKEFFVKSMYLEK